LPTNFCGDEIRDVRHIKNKTSIISIRPSANIIEEKKGNTKEKIMSSKLKRSQRLVPDFDANKSSNDLKVWVKDNDVEAGKVFHAVRGSVRWLDALIQKLSKHELGKRNDDLVFDLLRVLELLAAKFHKLEGHKPEHTMAKVIYYFCQKQSVTEMVNGFVDVRLAWLFYDTLVREPLDISEPSAAVLKVIEEAKEKLKMSPQMYNKLASEYGDAKSLTSEKTLKFDPITVNIIKDLIEEDTEIDPTEKDKFKAYIHSEGISVNIQTPWDASSVTDFTVTAPSFTPVEEVLQASDMKENLLSESSISEMFEYVLRYLYTALEKITHALLLVRSTDSKRMYKCANASKDMLVEIKKNVQESFQNGKMSALAACKCTRDPKTRAVQCDCSGNADCPSAMINIPDKEFVNIASFPSLVEICKRK
jgi:hypothetical protein